MVKFLVILAGCSSIAVAASGQSADFQTAGGSPEIIDTPTSDTTPTPSSSPSNAIDWDKVKKEAEAREAAANADKAASDAEKAATEARIAADKAKIGTVAGSSFTGLVTTPEKSGKVEAMLLVSVATRSAASKIIADLSGKVDGKTLLIVTDKADLGTTDAILYDIRKRSIEKEIDAATSRFGEIRSRDKFKRAAGGDAHFVPLAAAGAVLDAVTKLGSYFQSDYAFGAIDMVDAPDLLPSAVISECVRLSCNNKFVIVGNYVPTDGSSLITDLTSLGARYNSLLEDQAFARKRVEELGNIRGDAVPDLIEDYKRIDLAIGRVLTKVDMLVTDLTATPDNKEPLALRILRQRWVQTAIKDQGDYVMFLNARNYAAYYTRKSLWTFIGGPPLNTAGTIVASYNVYNPVSGVVEVSGVVGKHSGYMSVKKVQRLPGATIDGLPDDK